MKTILSFLSGMWIVGSMVCLWQHFSDPNLIGICAIGGVLLFFWSLYLDPIK